MMRAITEAEDGKAEYCDDRVWRAPVDHTITLDSRQEAELQAVADKFVHRHKGDTMKALKEMTVLDGHMQGELEKLEQARRGFLF